MDNKETVASFLTDHAGGKPVSFHTPGHKGSAFFARTGYGDVLRSGADRDLTEIPGSDNLFAPEGILRDAAERYREAFSSRASFLLVNGSTCGIEAALLSVLRRGSRVILPRSSHRAVFSGLRLAGAVPVYLRQDVLPDSGLPGGISPDAVGQALAENPEACAVVLTSPDYYGTMSRVSEIAALVHHAGKILIVDQAHGAHLFFADKYLRDPAGLPPSSAERCGADIVIESTHKTLCSFTQSSVAHLYGSRVDPDAFEEALEMTESSSPSYLLLESLDRNLEIMTRAGRELMRKWQKDLAFFRPQAAKLRGIRLVTGTSQDPSKLLFDASGLFCSAVSDDLPPAGEREAGTVLEQELIRRGIWPEFSEGPFVLCLTGIGNVRSDYEKLLDALQDIEREFLPAGGTRGAAVEKKEHPAHGSGMRAGGIRREGVEKEGDAAWAPVREDAGMRSAAEVPLRTERIPLADAEGRICAVPVTPMPPGIPVICPGERYDAEAVRKIARLAGEGRTMTGIGRDGRVSVGEEQE